MIGKKIKGKQRLEENNGLKLPINCFNLIRTVSLIGILNDKKKVIACIALALHHYEKKLG